MIIGWDSPLDIARSTKIAVNKIGQHVQRASTYFLQATVGLADNQMKPGTESGISLDTVRDLLKKSREHLTQALQEAEDLKHEQMAEALTELIKTRFSENDTLEITIEHAFGITRAEAQEIVIGEVDGGGSDTMKRDCERCGKVRQCEEIPQMGYSEWLCKACYRAHSAYDQGDGNDGVDMPPREF